MARATAYGQPISNRAAGRATLARQHLLDPQDLTSLTLVEDLLGLQAQTPWTWYDGFRSRMTEPDPADISEHLADRRLVRISTMRSTIHLHSPQDAACLRSLTQPAHDRTLRANFGRDLGGLDLDQVTQHCAELFENLGPQTFKELGQRLAERWDSTKPHALAMVARHRLPLVQVPPRGLWRTSGPIAHTTLSAWVGSQISPTTTLRDLVLRYLAAFGPASVADFQTWSGLTRTAPTFTELEDELLPFVADDGRQLYDLPDAPRPPEDTPAPPRLLYDYDNLLLSHKNRTRFTTEHYVAQNYHQDPVTPRIVLLDGITAGTWTAGRHGDDFVVNIQLYPSAPRADHDHLLEESLQLARWWCPERQPKVEITVL